ncbi:MAG: hypothetical protein LBG43_03340 [Treponema sp.]|nr:hypothetical protein [Treponema sp.]
MAIINNVNEAVRFVRIKLYPNHLSTVECAYIARTDNEASLSIEGVWRKKHCGRADMGRVGAKSGSMGCGNQDAIRGIGRHSLEKSTCYGKRFYTDCTGRGFLIDAVSDGRYGRDKKAESGRYGGWRREDNGCGTRGIAYKIVYAIS